MLIAVLAAILPNLIWFTCTYLHLSNPSITIRVRAGGKLASLIITITLFCLIAQKIEYLSVSEANGPLKQESEEVERMVKIFGGPENYLHYLDTKGGVSPSQSPQYR